MMGNEVTVSEDLIYTLRLLAHDLNNPLTAVRVLTEMMAEDLVDSDLQQDAADILEAADLCGAMVGGLGALMRIHAGEEPDYTWSTFELVELIRGVAERPAFAGAVDLQLPPRCEVSGDRRALTQAVTDILVNGRRLVEKGARLRLKVFLSHRGAHIAVLHPGVMLSASAIEALREPFQQWKIRKEQTGVYALGLAYADHVMRHHNGSLEVRPISGGVQVVATVGAAYPDLFADDGTMEP